MQHIDFIPTFADAKEMRAFGYTGPVQLDKVLRWFRERENVHINPVFARMGYKVTVITEASGELIAVNMGSRVYKDYYAAAWAGVQRAKFYINNHKREEKTKIVITEKLIKA